MHCILALQRLTGCVRLNTEGRSGSVGPQDGGRVRHRFAGRSNVGRAGWQFQLRYVLCLSVQTQCLYR